MKEMELLARHADEHPYPLLFATISGAHLYGFPSPDSDFDLRGAHILPLREVVGLKIGPETIERSGVRDGIELDLVTHDVRKFFSHMLKKNGYVLEQLHSPLVVRTTPEFMELREIAKGCVTRHHVHYYLGFLATQRNLFRKEDPPRVKPILYIYRIILTGIHLMRTGEIEANLPKLNEEYRLPYIAELIERKVTSAEKGTLPEADMAFHEKEQNRLEAILKEAGEKSTLPEEPSAGPALHDLLLRVRLGGDRRAGC